MFLIFGYFIGSFVLAAILVLLGSMIRPVKQQGEASSGKALLTWWLLVALAPYLYIEALTYWKGREMARAVRTGLDRAGLEGELQYYRVMRAHGGRGAVLAVVEERPLWDASTQRTLVRLYLVQEEGRWVFSNYEFVHSPARNKDGISIPPYW